MTEDTKDLLRDIRRWVKIIGIQEAKPVLSGTLSHDDSEKQDDLRIAYHLTDGEHSNRDISEYVDFSHEWVRSRQSEWAQMGLVEKDNPNSPYEKIITLEEAGLEIPEIPSPNGGDD